MLERLLDDAEAVLFDFDGVIVDSEPFYYLSYNKAFEKRGHSIDRDEYWEFWTSRGEGIPGEIKRNGLDIADAEVEVMYRERMDHFSAFCREGAIPFFPGMLETLIALCDKGMPCAIASSSFEPDILVIFEKAGHATPPCTVVGRRKGLRPKPHADIFVYAAGVLGFEPANCLVIEDAHKGLDAAKAVGMRCAVLKNDYNRDLDYPGADAVIESHAAFADAVRSWRSDR